MPLRRCVVDNVPHTVAAGDVPILTNLAEMVVRELEKDKLLQLQKLVRPSVASRWLACKTAA